MNNWVSWRTVHRVLIKYYFVDSILNESEFFQGFYTTKKITSWIIVIRHNGCIERDTMLVITSRKYLDMCDNAIISFINDGTLLNGGTKHLGSGFSICHPALRH